MQNTLIVSILPYAVMVGLVASSIAFIGLVVGTILRFRDRNVDILPRLDKIESEILSDSVILRQMQSTVAKLGTVHSAVSDLSQLAVQLQKRTQDVRRIVRELESTNSGAIKVEEASKLVSIRMSTALADLSLDDILSRIEKNRQELSRLQVEDLSSRG